MRQRRSGQVLACAAWLAAMLTLANGAGACETPVYRFAMYSPQWAPWPYLVFGFAGARADAETQRVHEILRTASARRDAAANLRFEAVDPADAGALEGVPVAVRELFEAHRVRRARARELERLHHHGPEVRRVDL